ncbi:MAG: hypothetical protein ACOX7K_02900 [Oscillospiraceae bacterium]|jgi:hypothetical protein
MYFAIGWLAVIVVSLVFFCMKFGATKISEKDVIYLPKFLFYFGCFLHLIGGALSVVFLYKMNGIVFVMGVMVSLVGVAAMLCQLNQKTTMTSSSTFEYTTFLGNTREYHFSDVVGIKLHNDSLTILMTSGKIHVESMAVINEDFVDRIDEVLEKQDSISVTE